MIAFRAVSSEIILTAISNFNVRADFLKELSRGIEFALLHESLKI